MKKVLLIFGFTLLLFGCSAKQDNSELNVVLVEKYIQAVEKLDYKTMGELLDENYVGLGPSINDSIGKTAVIENWELNVNTLYKGIKYNKSRNMAVQISEGENKGEWVSNWAELTIDYQFDQTVTIWANTVYKIQNGKIVRSFSFYNELDVYEQLGFEFY